MAPPDPMITAAAELRRRQNDAGFMGWQYNSAHSAYEAQTCDPGLSFYIGATNVDCCPITQTTCNPAIGCGAGSIIYTYAPAGTRTTTLTTAIPCTVQAGASWPYCGTAFFFEYLGAPNPKTEYFCDVTSYKLTMYRSKPSGPTSTPTPTPAQTPSNPQYTPNSPVITPDPSPTPHSKSKAWIAGAIIGPLIGIALIGAIIFVILSQKKKKKSQVYANQPQVGGATMATAQYPTQPPVGVGGYTDAKPGFGAQETPYNPHHSYGGVPVSPVPPYSSPQAYVPPTSPAPPQQYAHEFSADQTYTPPPGAATGTAPAASPAAPRAAPAELS